MAVRQALLAILDALERELQTERRTAELARENKDLRKRIYELEVQITEMQRRQAVR